VYRICPSCDAVNAAESAFCHRCLTPLDGSVALDAVASEDVAVTPYKPHLDPPGHNARVHLPRPPKGAGRTEDPTPILATPVTHASRGASPDLPGRPIAGGNAAAEGLDPLTLARDPLAGLDQVLPFEEGVLAAQRAPLKPARAAWDASEEADLYQRVATEPASLAVAGHVVSAATVARPLPRLGRAVLYLLVLAAALAPWFSGNITGALVRPRASVMAFASDLSAIPAGDAVLVAFDYGPTSAGELDPLALAALQGLASRGVRILALSTDPAGLGQAQRLLEALSAGAPEYRYGEDYAILGFVPAQEAGLRAAGESLRTAFPLDYRQAQPLDALPALSGIASVRDVERVIVISDDSQALRRWIEQVQSRSGVHIDALVTAAVEPLLAPFRQSRQLGHVVAAATGAAEFRLASGAPAVSAPGAVDHTDGYAALAIVVVAVAVATNVAELAAWSRRIAARRTRHGGTHAAPRRPRAASGKVR